MSLFAIFFEVVGFDKKFLTYCVMGREKNHFRLVGYPFCEIGPVRFTGLHFHPKYCIFLCHLGPFGLKFGSIESIRSTWPDQSPGTKLPISDPLPVDED